MEYQKTYDGEGLKGALWTIAGTQIFNAATRGMGCNGCGNGGILGSLFGNGCNCGNPAVFAQAESTISALQADNARLRSEKYSDNKVQELYNYTVGQNQLLSNELCFTRQRLAVLEHQMSQFGTLTTLRIPNEKTCPGIPAVEVVHTATASTANAPQAAIATK